MGKSPQQRRLDRARPFSRKHARYWLTAVGGMAFIMLVNLALGFWFTHDRPAATPPPQYAPIPPMVIIDAGVGDAGAPPPTAP